MKPGKDVKMRRMKCTETDKIQIQIEEIVNYVMQVAK